MRFSPISVTTYVETYGVDHCMLMTDQYKWVQMTEAEFKQITNAKQTIEHLITPIWILVSTA